MVSLTERLQLLCKSALWRIESDNFKEAIKELTQCQSVVEANDTFVYFNFLVFVQCNLSYCYYKLGKTLEAFEALNYLNSKSQALETHSPNQLKVQLHRSYYMSIVNLQISNLMCETGNHIGAYQKARACLSIAEFLISGAVQAYKLEVAKINSLKSRKSIEKQVNSTSIYQKAVPLLKTLLSFIRSGKFPDSNTATIRSLLGLKSYPQWTHSMSSHELTKIKPVSLEELKTPKTLSNEFSKNYTVLKVGIICAGLLSSCLELKHAKLNSTLSYSKKELQTMTSKALKLIKCFFPPESPLRVEVTKLAREELVEKTHMSLCKLPVIKEKPTRKNKPSPSRGSSTHRPKSNPKAVQSPLISRREANFALNRLSISKKNSLTPYDPRNL